eukprot:GHVN01007171.1.p1 GENE.GHVN01007171.1~~GHVN01007171.1.p1  ORF type:complete len:172 (+),score=19.34 GHVN01007171.1:33-548(+)
MWAFKRPTANLTHSIFSSPPLIRHEAFETRRWATHNGVFVKKRRYLKDNTKRTEKIQWNDIREKHRISDLLKVDRQQKDATRNVQEVQDRYLATRFGWMQHQPGRNQVQRHATTSGRKWRELRKPIFVPFERIDHLQRNLRKIRIKHRRIPLDKDNPNALPIRAVMRFPFG